MINWQDRTNNTARSNLQTTSSLRERLSIDPTDVGLMIVLFIFGLLIGFFPISTGESVVGQFVDALPFPLACLACAVAMWLSKASQFFQRNRTAATFLVGFPIFVVVFGLLTWMEQGLAQ